MSKCQFGVQSIEYLGHVISKEGVATDPQKVACMREWPVPKTIKQLRGFLGLTGYYRKFIKHYGLISRPLTELLKKDNFKWGEGATKAFEELKNAMVSAPVLALPDFNQPFTLETDASGVGVGAVLMQNQRPLAFMSKAFGPRHQLLSVYEREFLAVIIAVQRWKSYLQGHKFFIKTDQQALKHLLDQKVMNPVQQKWITKLLGLDYEIQYKKGVENKVADALSRYPTNEEDCHSLTTVTPLWMQRVKQSYTGDAYFSQVLISKPVDPTSYAEYTVVSGIIQYKGRVVVGSSNGLRQTILEEVHNTSFGRTLGSLGNLC